jgi:cathepsin A (carboxypeptidase C)
MIFLDQPVGTGFSFSDSGKASYPTTSEAIAIDLHAFLDGWFDQFPEYADKPFHLAGESWAGHMIPEVATLIHARNKEALLSGRRKIKLESLLLGNTLTSPLNMFGSLPRYLCDGPYALLQPGSTECTHMEDEAKKCTDLIQECYDKDDVQSCVAAEKVCWNTDLVIPVDGAFSLFLFQRSPVRLPAC